MTSAVPVFMFIIMIFAIWTYFYMVVPGVRGLVDIVRAVRIHTRARRAFTV